MDTSLCSIPIADVPVSGVVTSVTTDVITTGCASSGDSNTVTSVIDSPIVVFPDFSSSSIHRQDVTGVSTLSIDISSVDVLDDERNVVDYSQPLCSILEHLNNVMNEFHSLPYSYVSKDHIRRRICQICRALRGRYTKHGSYRDNVCTSFVQCSRICPQLFWLNTIIREFTTLSVSHPGYDYTRKSITRALLVKCRQYSNPHRLCIDRSQLIICQCDYPVYPGYIVARSISNDHTTRYLIPLFLWNNVVSR